MKKEPATKLTEQEERLLSAFVDGELDAFDRREIDARIAAGDPLVTSELQNVEFVREQFQSWFSAEVGSSKIDVWSAIQAEVAKAAKESRRSPFEAFTKAVEEFFRPRYVGAFAAGMAALLLAFQIRSSGIGAEGTRPPEELAANDLGVTGELVSGEQLDGRAPGQPLLIAGNRLENDLLARVGITDSRREIPARLPVPEALAVRLLSKPQVFADRRLAGGLRTGETDIEWIKTQTPFRLVSNHRPDTTPVVWVARAK